MGCFLAFTRGTLPLPPPPHRRCQRFNAHIWLGKQTHIGTPCRRPRAGPGPALQCAAGLPGQPADHKISAPFFSPRPLPACAHARSSTLQAGTFHSADQAAVAHDVMELWRSPTAQGLNFDPPSYYSLLPLLRALTEVRAGGRGLGWVSKASCGRCWAERAQPPPVLTRACIPLGALHPRPGRRTGHAARLQPLPRRSGCRRRQRGASHCAPHQGGFSGKG